MIADGRFPIRLMGRTIGTADGYDFDPMEVIQYYNFQPAVGFNAAACDTLAVFVHTGIVQRYVNGKGAEEGRPAQELKLWDLLMNLKPANDQVATNGVDDGEDEDTDD